jgi:hypothetical protein
MVLTSPTVTCNLSPDPLSGELVEELVGERVWGTETRLDQGRYHLNWSRIGRGILYHR